MRTVIARTIRRTAIFLLFLSILALMLNSFLPIVILKNQDKLVYFNIESMQYSDNINIQNLYNDINLINIFIWLIIIFIFIAFFGVIINISEIYEKISYLFLTLGCLSIVFSSISCYLYFIFISNVVKIDNVQLAYIVEPFRYSYIIIIVLILTILISISYIITTLPYLFRTIKDTKSNKQELTKEKPVTKSFSKPVEPKKSFSNNKQVINKDFNFEKKKELAESWLANESNKIERIDDEEEQEFKEDLETDHIKKETMDEQISVDNINIEHSDEKRSPFSEEDKQKKDETSEVKISESFEKALFSAIDKKKKVEIGQEKNNQKIVEKSNDVKKEESIKKYSVKCPECKYIFIKEKNEESITKIRCPRCGKEGVIK